MTEAIRFLHALAQALAAMALYSPGHPAVLRAVDTAWEALERLLADGEEHVFLFLGTAPVYAGRVLHELAAWPWSPRLSRAGMQRITFSSPADRDGLQDLLQRLQLRLGGQAEADTAPPIPGISYGTVDIDDTAIGVGSLLALNLGEQEGGGRELQLDLTDELAAFAYIRERAAADVLAWTEADAIVRILHVHLENHALPQAAPPSDATSYPQVHAINTALLAMAAGRATGLERLDTHRLGMAALLHDLGMARITPRLSLAERLTASERAEVETHPARGAELLLGKGGRTAELTATVAWEHHLHPDGSGYPVRRIRAPMHWASRLVAVSSTFASLRCPRPFRAAWSTARAVAHLEEGAGSRMDREAVALVLSLVQD